jgi:uncharacterized protein (DUF39 family)
MSPINILRARSILALNKEKKDIKNKVIDSKKEKAKEKEKKKKRKKKKEKKKKKVKEKKKRKEEKKKKEKKNKKVKGKSGFNTLDYKATSNQFKL